MRHQTHVSPRSDWLQRPELWWFTLLVAVETVGLGGYLLLTNTEVGSLRYVVYPFVWINVGVVGVVHVTARPASRRTHLVASALAAVYFLVLALLAGLVSVDLGALFAGHGQTHAHAHVHGLQLSMTMPGWGPRVGYAGDAVTVNAVPFRVIGYLALSYLVYAALCDLTSAALSGVLGLASCLSCTLPIVGSLSAGLVGGAGALAALSAFSLDISTAVFVGSVLLLSVRPTVGEGP